MTKRYLTKEHVIRIHKELIDRYGGLHGIMDERLIESALGRLQSGYYADPIEEAAALMESLAANHPFFDGNKRIAVTSSFTFLMLNGYDVSLDEDEAFTFITGLLETGHFSFERIEPWMRRNVVATDQASKDIEQPGS